MPAHTNRRALNKACVIKWNKAMLGSPIPSLPIITPSWLNVESAIIFFRSGSTVAARPAMSIVKQAMVVRRVLKLGMFTRNG